MTLAQGQKQETAITLNGFSSNSWKSLQLKNLQKSNIYDIHMEGGGFEILSCS